MRGSLGVLLVHTDCHGTPHQCEWDEALRAADTSIEMEERFNSLGAGEPDRRPTAELRTSPVAGDPIIAGLLDKLDEHLTALRVLER